MIIKRLRSLFHRLRGRREGYQLYTNIIYSTPPECLDYHGEIYFDEEDIPDDTDCKIEVLDFPIAEIDHYRQKKDRMKDKVDQELRRRELLEQGSRLFEQGDYEEAVLRLEESARIDVFLAEVEELCQQYVEELPPEPRRNLKEVLITRYKDKYGKKRYERWPERMREQRKEAGLELIRELFE